MALLRYWSDRRRSPRGRVILILCVSAALGSLLVGLGWRRTRTAGGDERVLLSLDDPGLEVVERPLIAKTVTILRCDANGSTRETRIDDDMVFGMVRVAAYREWLLVLNENWVVAGYNKSTGTLIGEGDWDQLPIHGWHGEGQIVAEYQHRPSSQATVPLGFPRQ